MICIDSEGEERSFVKLQLSASCSFQFQLTADPIYLASGMLQMQIHTSAWKNRLSALNSTLRL